jgi:mRNA interferase HigB
VPNILSYDIKMLGAPSSPRFEPVPGSHTEQGLSGRVLRESLTQSDQRRAVALALVPIWDYHSRMRIIALSTLKQFWENNPEYLDVQQPALAWYQHAKRADWATPADVKADLRNASILKDGRVVFNLAGNKYRLVVWINYAYRVVYIRFIGTHAQYDRIDVQTI